MNENLKNEKAIREYLLGRVSDETLLAEYEELLFLDEDFCALAEIVEDDLINDFVFGKLDAKDAKDFSATLECNPQRREKIALTKAIKAKAIAQKSAEKETKPSFFDSLKAFFQKPLNVGAFAVLLIGVFALAWFVLNRQNTDEIADLKTIYDKERPTEARLSEFDYAPLVVTRGAAEEREKNKLRRIENTLLEAVEKNPNAQTHHALGVFYLTQRKFDDALKELESAAKLNEKDAKILNDLGSAYFEKAKTESNEKKLERLAKALENFSRAAETDPQSLPALFNKSLCLQELRLYNQAKESWEAYLEKDGKSPWADEARKNLERLEQLKSTSKTKEQVLEDFLAAYRNRDEETVWKINSQTREMISGVWLPDQLSRKFLEAEIRGDDATATESIEALKFIGNLEKTRNADFFVAELADFYSACDSSKFADLLKAKDLFSAASQFLLDKKWSQSVEKFRQAKEVFDKNGDFYDSQIVRYWLAFNLREISKFDESLQEFSALLKETESRKFRFLAARILSTESEIQFRQNNLSKSVLIGKQSLQIAEEIQDLPLIQKNSTNLADIYQYIGESHLSLKHFSTSIFSDNPYFESSLQKLRNLWYSSTLLRETDLPFCAVYFGEEALSFAKMQKNDTALVFDTTVDLGISYTALKKFEKAAALARENLNLADNFEDEDGKNFAQIESNLQSAHIFRLMNECEKSIEHYNTVIGGLEKIKEFQVNTFEAHQGRLICYEKLNRQADFENELQTVGKLFEDYRHKITEEENRNSFFDREQNFSNIAADYSLKQNQPQKAFEFIENSKARSLLDLLEGNGFYDAQTKEIVFKSSAKPFSLQEIQAKLPPAVEILQYAVLDDKLAIWHISKNEFELQTVDISAEHLEEKVKMFLAQIKEKSLQTKQTSHKLYDILFKPFSAKLDKTKKIGIVPDSILYNLPFAALVSSENEKFVIEDFTLFYAPSSSTLISLSEKAKAKPAAENLLAIGNPDFNKEINPSLQSLGDAENEVRAAANFYAKNSVLIKTEAVKSRLPEKFSQANIFHFAGHYIVNPNSSLNSKLLLTQPSDSTDEFDGELRTFEILQMKNPHLKLAVLSACETGVEKFYKGEGAIGMARTFLAIGTPIVVASQWKVESEAASELMIDFHRNRKIDNISSIEALQKAQIAMIKTPKFNEPFYWSAFSVIGGAADY